MNKFSPDPAKNPFDLSRWALPIAVGVTLLIRLTLSAVSSGTNDMVWWEHFAYQINQYGLCYMYQHVWRFNHPPLMAYLSKDIFQICRRWDLWFPFYFRLVTILADVLAVIVLWKKWAVADKRTATWIVFGFAVAPLAVFMSGYHGNTDSLGAALCLLSAFLLESHLPFWGGLALAGAVNVKLIPVLLVPAFVLSCRSRRDMAKVVGGLAVGLVPFLPAFVSCSGHFYRNVIAYNSRPDFWGVMMIVWYSGRIAFFHSAARVVGSFFVAYGRFLIMGLACLVGFWARRKNAWDRYELGALCFAVFLVCTPGFGVQYLIYACPLLFAVSLRWGLAYSWLAGIYVGRVYYFFCSSYFPLHSRFHKFLPLGDAVWFGFLTWALLIYFSVRTLLHTEPHKTI